MRLQRGFTNKEWKEISEKYGDGGVHDYRGKKTLFYKGEKLWEGRGKNGHPIVYDLEERNTWQVVAVLSGVEEIPTSTFYECRNVKTVIMSDTVKRVEECTFHSCISLEFVKLSRNLEYIGWAAFSHCTSIYSIFIPPSCREIVHLAFSFCEKLTILSVPQTIELGEGLIFGTKLIQASHFDANGRGGYSNNAEVNEWITHLNQEQEFALHHECASYEPSKDNIYEMIKEQGLSSLNTENKIGITASKYLQENPFFENEVEEKKLINSYVLDLMGEFIA
ncbi:hypothetical protein CTEN210_13429 [Chaetoceros tenuissimus]|uniref:Leucine-rich repeat domain-containing protein n=1 Tax=Chaetoceros tenuissimus TaxID=426638 RepID=A0AAD3D3B2_9STRA|nr:hypothetical protein CTEN210_13429 [Chaetoceros tenuissimus]